MRHFIFSVVCILLAGSSQILADDTTAALDNLSGMRARADRCRDQVSLVQQFAPDQVHYCQQLCDGIDQGVALCEMMIHRAQENGLNPAMQVAIVQQYAQVQQLYQELQAADAQLGRTFPH